MKRLQDLIGTERRLDQVSDILRDAVREAAAPVVGALQVTCSDESELECSASFQRWFVDYALPDLKLAARAPFRTCNLGGRYEWGSVRTAEQHFATPASADAFKLLVVKLNAHVAVSEGPQGPRYGLMQRYEVESMACGALHAVLEGGHLPALDELREALASRGHDRTATLLDSRRVVRAHRYLFAAIASARVQAQRAIDDIQKHKPHTPTLYLVVPCVTLNRTGPDAELLVGCYWADYRATKCDVQYHGLGDDPGRYRAGSHAGRLHVTET